MFYRIKIKLRGITKPPVWRIMDLTGKPLSKASVTTSNILSDGLLSTCPDLSFPRAM